MNRYEMTVICLDNKGLRPGEFIIGKQYDVYSDDVLQLFIFGDRGTEYNWTNVHNLFTPVEQWRDKQLDKLGIYGRI